ncbi:MAG: hypothetical protein GXO18_03200 [Aquificae bacterium]|nr:hypothetical protein [Aquificota bacterium]
MDTFAKVFKNVVVILCSGSVKEVFRTGFSLKLNPQESVIELYREEGRLTTEGSSSKGTRRRIAYRGSPNIEGIYSLLALKVSDGRVPLLRRTDIHIKEEVFGSYTERVVFYQVSFNIHSGEVLKENLIDRSSEHLGTLRPPRGIEDFLSLTHELWTLIDRFDNL